MYATQGLVEALLGFAAEREPESVTIQLAVTPAGELETDLDPDTPVFTDFYLPEAGRSVTAVFGMDLSTPAGQTPGLFVSHPDGNLGITKRDDLKEVVFVAVPPWEPSSLAAFDRAGRKQELTLLDVDGPDRERDDWLVDEG